MCIRSTSLEQINPESHENLLPLGAISMGEDVAQFAAQLPSLLRDVKEEFKSFLQYVQLFYIEAAKQIKQRFPIDNNVLKLLTVLNPDTINSTPASNVVSLAKLFPNIIPEVEVECIETISQYYSRSRS